MALGNEPVRVGGEIAGRVTTGGYGYTVERSIAYAYLPPEQPSRAQPSRSTSSGSGSGARSRRAAVRPGRRAGTRLRVSAARSAPPYDEAYDERGEPRPHYAELLASLGDPGALREEAHRRLGARGVTFGDGETARFDPVPRILPDQEWADLEIGIGQAARPRRIRT